MEPEAESDLELAMLCEDAGLPLGHVEHLLQMVHQQGVVTLDTAVRGIGLSEEDAKRAFRLASLASECWEEGGRLYFLPDFAERLSRALRVSPYDVAQQWETGMGLLRSDFIRLFDGTVRGKELKFQLEQLQTSWSSKMNAGTFQVFMALTVAECHIEESVSVARFALAKVKGGE